MVNLNLFVEPIETFHPKSLDYRKYWAEIKRRCIEGYWIGGKYCPPSLYFYLNLGTIWIKKSRFSKSQIKGRPRNLDYLWDRINYPWMEARGITGFSNLPNPTEAELRDILYNYSPTGNLGRPLYERDPRNMILMTNRGSGKTSWGANECAREFLTDAAREYNPGEPSTKAEIIVGAFDAKLSTVPVKALQLALSELPGAQTINGRYYPCPLSKITSGSFMPSKDVEHYYRKKIGGKWLEFGSRSIIKHRTYGDNPFASQGGRYTTKLAEEIGMWDNLLDCHHADENQVIGNSKLGSTLYIGTGGDMKSGTLAAHKMFYDPEGYNCVYMEDRWENRGKIGIFISATETKMDYKNADGVTDFLLGEKTEIERRAEKKKAKEPGVYEEYIIYNPLVPSEIFLSKTHNVFPIGEIQARLAELETNKIFTDGTYIGTLDIDTLGNLTWKENRDLEPIYDYPVRKKQHGCITIFNPPITDETDQIPYGRYIAGLDPFAQDGAESSVSLGSFFIYDRFTDNIVAEYTGRPDTTNEYHESCRRLLKYYRAKCLYENQIKGFFDYMKFKNETYLLADQPSFLKDIIKDTGVNREKGFHMTKGVKSYGISLINNYLRSSAEDPEKPEKLSVHKVRSIGLLKELMYFNDDGNFDRIVSFMACLFLKQEMIKMELDLDYNTTVLPRQQQNFFNKPLFNKKVFY